MGACPGYAGNDLIVRAFAEAVATYQQLHGVSTQRANMNTVPESRPVDIPVDRQAANQAEPSTSQASGVEVRHEAAGPVPANPQASQAHVAPKETRSVESGVHGPYNGTHHEQEPQSSKHRFYKHHAVTAAKLKKQHKDPKAGLQKQLEHEAAVSARTKVTVPNMSDAQPTATPFVFPYPLPQATPSLQQSYPYLPVPPNPDASKGAQPTGQYTDPKLWQMPYFPAPVPPPFFFGLGPNGLPSLSLWHQMQFYNALQGQALMPQTFAAAQQQQFAQQQMSQQQQQQMSQQHLAQQAAMPQQPMPAPPVWSGPAPVPSFDSLNRSEQVAAASIGLSCKQQIENMAETGLPTEAQLEAAARQKAAELGDQDLAQLLMAWYYAGYYTGNRAANGPPAT